MGSLQKGKTGGKEYWRYIWRDSSGRQRSRGLGSCEKISPRAAMALARRIEAEQSRGGSGVQCNMTLEQYLARYAANHTRHAEGTRYLRSLTGWYLTAFFGAKKRISDISKAEARDWMTALENGDIALEDDKGERVNNDQLSLSTIARTVRDARVMFAEAEADDMILFNPFGRLKVDAPKPEKTWHYVSMDELDKLLLVCPNNSWKCLIALARLAGMRKGEIFRLRWAHVDFDKGMLTVQNPGRHQTTKKRTRATPISPKLAGILNEAFLDGDGADLVCHEVNQGGARPKFHGICKRAGLEPWKKWCHTMRKNLESDWASILPGWAVQDMLGGEDEDEKPATDLKAVTKALGNSPEVAKAHYLKVDDSLYAAITGRPSSVAKTVANQESQIHKSMSA